MIKTPSKEIDQLYEFEIQRANVMSEELISSKYYSIVEESPTKEQFVNIDRRIDQYDDHVKFFVDMDTKIINELLKDTFYCKENFEVIKYNVGPNISYDWENIIAGGYEIELTESSIYSILDVPSGVIIKG